MEDLFDFRWVVPRSGYRTIGRGRREFLVEAPPREYRVGDPVPLVSTAPLLEKPTLFLEIRAGRLIGPALFWVRAVVDEQLAETVHAQLHPRQDTLGLALHVIPVSLLGAMWLQIARAISGQKRYKACPVCSTPIEISIEW